MRTRVFLPLMCAFCSVLTFAVEPNAATGKKCRTESSSGAEICQITSSGRNIINYYDVPAYSAKYDKIVYESETSDGHGGSIVLANPDGSNPQVVTRGRDQTVSPDGSKIYYRGQNSPDPGQDVYVYDIGSKKITRITHVNSREVILFSPAAPTPKGDLLVYADGPVAHLVYGDGTGDKALDFGDPYPQSPFHRIRIDPYNAKLILFNRSQSRYKELFVYNTETGKTYQVASPTSHMMWSPDGVHVLYNGGPEFRLHLAKWDGSEDKILDPKERLGTEYCSFTPEADVVVCANVDRSGRLPFPAGLYLLTTDGSGKVSYIGKHDSTNEHYWGMPALIFTKDRYHMIFRSDASGDAEVYTATLPKSIYDKFGEPPRPDPSQVRERQQPARPNGELPPRPH